jgi:signal transducer and activator of transcription 5B
MICRHKGSVNYAFNFRNDIDPDNPQHEQYAASVVAALIQELINKAQSLTSEEFFLTKIKLEEAANMFRVS